MVRGVFEGRRGLGLAIAVAAGVSACDLKTGPDRVFVQTPVSVSVVQGAEAVDSIEAAVPIRIQLTPEDASVPTPLRVRVAFSVEGEDCGEPTVALTSSDENDQAATTWSLGSLVGSCQLDIRVLADDGTILGLGVVTADVVAGQPVAGWLLPGEVATDTDTLSFDVFDTPLEDRFANLLQWGLQVVEGPAIVLGTDLDEEASRTLVATGVGGGLLDVVTPWGTWLRAGFDVCEEGGNRWVRAFRLADSTAVRASCP